MESSTDEDWAASRSRQNSSSIGAFQVWWKRYIRATRRPRSVGGAGTGGGGATGTGIAAGGTLFIAIATFGPTAAMSSTKLSRNSSGSGCVKSSSRGIGAIKAGSPGCG